MKNALIISLGILAFFSFGTHAIAQTLKADNVDFFAAVEIWNVNTADSVDFYSVANFHNDPLNTIFSVTMPSTKDPKWTIILKSGETIVTTWPVIMMYRPKNKGSAAARIDAE